MSNQEPETSPSPWHAGEKRIHARLGISERMEVSGRKVIRDYMPDQHRDFYKTLPFMLLGSVDAEGCPWASILEGKPGFAHSPDPRTLSVDVQPKQGDPAHSNLAIGAAVGLLGIELPTRRRNRINGKLSRLDERGFTVAVDQTFGNCPQYIQRRSPRFEGDLADAPRAEAEWLSGLDEAARAMIRAADTFFVASYVDPEGNIARRAVDVSHRGGKPGFVHVDGDCLTVPDFAGNLHFNTIGNLLENPRAGFLFIDFATGDVVQLSGRAEIVLEGPDIEAFQGAERLLRLFVERAVRRPGALSLRFAFQDFSPNSLMTGSWEQAEARARAAALRDVWRPYRVAKIERESSSIASFYLEPTDGAGIPNFRAGQHVPLRFRLPSAPSPVIRTYTLSCAPSDAFFRISVKREGLISGHLHDHVHVGDVLEARAPQGEFVVDVLEPRPLVLLAAGVGVTPLLAMLRHVVYEGARKRKTRRTYFVYAARTLAERAFDAELKELSARAGADLHIVRVLSKPEPSTCQGDDFDKLGRIDIGLLKSSLPFDDFDFYLCGPGPFTQDLYDGLRALRIPDDRIHAEQFGPSTLRRSLEPGASRQKPKAQGEVSVLFALSGKRARWTPESGTLLDLAEASGLNPEFSCRGGSCGTCRARVKEGAVHYPSPPAVRTSDEEALLCCSVPAETDAANLVLDL